jgi:hypothetical protein
LKTGGRVSLVGGSWFPQRQRRNPQTGKTIQIAAKNVVKFKAGAELEGAVSFKPIIIKPSLWKVFYVFFIWYFLLFILKFIKKL